MQHFLSALVLAAIGAITWLSYNHPSLYLRAIGPPLIALAVISEILVGVYDTGISNAEVALIKHHVIAFAKVPDAETLSHAISVPFFTVTLFSLGAIFYFGLLALLAFYWVRVNHKHHQGT